MLRPEYGSLATTFVAKISVNWLYPSCDSMRSVSGSPTAIVVVGRFWYRIISRTFELSVFSAGKYSIGIGLPDLSILLKLLKKDCAFIHYPLKKKCVEKFCLFFFRIFFYHFKCYMNACGWWSNKAPQCVCVVFIKIGRNDIFKG